MIRKRKNEGETMSRIRELTPAEAKIACEEAVKFIEECKFEYTWRSMALATIEGDAKAFLKMAGAEPPNYKPSEEFLQICSPRQRAVKSPEGVIRDARGLLRQIANVEKHMRAGNTRQALAAAVRIGLRYARLRLRKNDFAIAEVKTHRAKSAAGTKTIRAAQAAKKRRLLPLVRKAMRERGFYKACAKVAREESAAGRKVSARTVERICAAAKQNRQ